MNRKQTKRPELPLELPPLPEGEAADDEFTAGEFSGLEDPEYNDERAQKALARLKEKNPGKWKPVARLTNK
ncbi:MAG: hypothetical protein JWQ49_3119 [Edaphobacter sp.]|nr:hypothetical protein [Edaphobacter sp.]